MYRVIEGLRVIYEGPSKLAALKAYLRELRKPFACPLLLADGTPVCPRHGQPLEEGFVDGGGGWHSESSFPEWANFPQTRHHPRCWDCEPYGSFPDEPLPDLPEDIGEEVLEDLRAARAEMAARSPAGQLRRIAASFNAAMRGKKA